MENLKIRVADEAESKEAQELFFKLGGKWCVGGCKIRNTDEPYLYLKDGLILHGSSGETFNTEQDKETTLQELRDMVNPMKEYLFKYNDQYTLVKLSKECAGSNPEQYIEVPDGANIYARCNIFGDYKWLPKIIDGEWSVLWQRHTQPEELPFVDDGITDCRESIQEIYKPTDFGAQSLNDQYAEIELVRQSGMKFDSNKPRHSLLPKGAVNSVIEVLEFGAKKYSADNWQEVDNAKERYYNAAMRHIDLWWNGEKLDPETNVHHLAHAATNLFFLMWFDNK